MTRQFSAMDLRKGLAQVPDRARPDPSAPSPEELWDAAHGHLEPRRAQQIIDQVITDPVLWEEWRLLEAFTQELAAIEQEPAANDEPDDDAGRRMFRWIAVGGGMAAALVAAISLQGVPRSPSEVVDDAATYRAESGDGLRSLVPADASLPRDAFELRWSAGADGVRYEVQVSTAAPRLLVHERGLTEARFVVPASALASVPSGSEILWRVEEIGEDGRRRSATFVTSIQ